LKKLTFLALAKGMVMREKFEKPEAPVRAGSKQIEGE